MLLLPLLRAPAPPPLSWVTHHSRERARSVRRGPGLERLHARGQGHVARVGAHVARLRRQQLQLLAHVGAVHAPRKRHAHGHEQALALALLRLAHAVHPGLEAVVTALDSGCQLAACIGRKHHVHNLLEVVLHHRLGVSRRHGVGQRVGQHVLEHARRVTHQLQVLAGHLDRQLGEGRGVRGEHARLHQRAAHQRLHLGLRQRLEVLPVHPPQLDLVKHGGRLGDALQAELGRQLVLGKDLLLGAVVPAQQRQVVDHGGRQEALGLELAHAGGAVALGQLGLVGRQDERHVREDGAREAQRVVDEHLAQRVGQVLLRADDVRDAHEAVVHRDAEVVHGVAVGAQQHKVAQRVGVPRDLAADDVADLDLLVLGHAEAVAVGRAGRLHRLHLLLAGGGPLAAVDGRQLLLLRLLLHGVQLLVGAEAGVRVAGRHQLVGQLLVDVRALGLAVGAVRAAHVGALVPVQAQPLEVAHHGLLGRARGARSVRVLDAQHELAAVAFGVQVVEQRGARAAHVQVAGGGGRKAHAHLSARGLRGLGGGSGLSHSSAHILGGPSRRALCATGDETHSIACNQAPLDQGAHHAPHRACHLGCVSKSEGSKCYAT
mmetsp:Transcript_7884/g.19695  ORF Transcript_7884/g.19695 Transcript_7884/m.19695 type:complete len:603 (-) Transcript_7884:9-1817(-)